MGGKKNLHKMFQILKQWPSLTQTNHFTLVNVSYNKNKLDTYLSSHDSILSLTFDMQIDTVTMIMEWMDFSVTQPSWFNDTLIN